MQKIKTFLTFDGRAEEAVKFYTSLFDDSKILGIERYTDGPQKGTVMGASFVLNGQEFMAMDVPGGFPKGEGVSLYVDCKTQEEVDHLWEKLSEGGEEQPCGWLRDKYGFSWQIIPSALPELIAQNEGEKKMAVINAMLGMKKIDIAGLEKAAQG
jgi:predicted 3-demethylubiquinone-9 3-methyltransferase (glyoxalase superfamily)